MVSLLVTQNFKGININNLKRNDWQSMESMCKTYIAMLYIHFSN